MKRYQPGPHYRRYWDGLRSVGKQPFTVQHSRWTTYILDAAGKRVTSLCLRGNSKQRRQQVRLALRYLNRPIVEEAKIDSLIIEMSSGGGECQLHNCHLVNTGVGGATGDFPTLSGVVMRLRGADLDDDWQENLDPHSRFKK
jgi:hypothetical protein